MLFKLILQNIAHGKARFVCAVLGVAVAAGAVVFTTSLVATNDAQAPKLCARAAAPFVAWKFDRNAPEKEKNDKKRLPSTDCEKYDLVQMTVDFRPNGHVLQGPPVRAVVTTAKQLPYDNAKIEQGRWPNFDLSAEPEVIGVPTAFARGGKNCPPLGSLIKFVGRKGTMEARLVGYLTNSRLPMGFPTVFANPAAFAKLANEEHGAISYWRKMPEKAPEDVITVEAAAIAFTSDAGRNLDRAKVLLLWAAALTALSLLINSLFLSIDANRRNIAILRLVGLTRGGVLKLVMLEAFVATAVGLLIGVSAAIIALFAYITLSPAMFPTGLALGARALVLTVAAALFVTIIAILVALRGALKVKPLEAASIEPVKPRKLGMLIAFSFGFGAFVAVEVWGASLMKPFIPSPEWPDAIVSILPGGASAFDVVKLQKLPGVKRIHELQPLQVNFLPEEPLSERGGGGRMMGGGGRRGMKPCRNALLLASDYLPNFKFVEGERAAAVEALATTNACIITEMMARARKIKIGDNITLGGRGFEMALPVVGIVDLNWHMVTSRGLVRGMNGAPINTDGPLFVSFDTLDALNMRPSVETRMTHLWLDYNEEFLAKNGVFEAGRKVEESIRTALKCEENIQLHARDEVADGTLAHGAQLIGDMARVPFIFLVVVTMGFVAMLAATAESAKYEFRTLKAVGATNMQLMGRLCMVAVNTALMGVVLGGSGGALAGWLFTSGTRAAMANWGLPPSFVVPWAPVLWGAVAALICTLVVAVPVALGIIGRRKFVVN